MGQRHCHRKMNHVFNSKLFSNTSFIYSNYNYVININANNNDINLVSEIRDFSLKEDMQYYINPANTLKFGIDAIHHTFSPGVINASSSSSFNSASAKEIRSGKCHIHIARMVTAAKLSHHLWHAPLVIFCALAGSYYTYDSSGNAKDTATYSSRAIRENLHQPRATLLCQLATNGKQLCEIFLYQKYPVSPPAFQFHRGQPHRLWIPSTTM